VNETPGVTFERDEALLSTGLGLDVQIKRNVNLRLDWGVVLDDINGGDVTRGDSRLHFSATVVF
jgi:hemolysin activation/secretion protein